MFKDLHINPVTLKLIEKEVGKSLKHMGTGEIKSGVQNYTDSSEYWMTEKQWNKFSISLVIKEMQIKTLGGFTLH